MEQRQARGDRLDRLRFVARRRSSGCWSAPSVAALVELVLIRPLYLRHIEQVLVTVGLSLALVALVQAIWGPDLQPYSTCRRG